MNIDGKFWPCASNGQTRTPMFMVTGSFALLGYLYVALAIAGIWFAWRTGGGFTASGAARSGRIYGELRCWWAIL